MARITSSASALVCAVALLLAGSVSAGAQSDTPPPPPPPESGAPTASPVPTGPDAPTPPAPEPAGGSRRYLLLPDISFIGTFTGHLSTDGRDGRRDRLRFEEGEVAIQGDVYPGLRANVFAVFGDGGDAVIEEGYLAVQNVGLGRLPLSANVGRRKVPFDRVNQLHPHSWLYVVPPYVLSNLVSGESLTGDGGYLSYLFPLPFFAQLDVGIWSVSESPEDFDAGADPSQVIVTSPGSGLADRFTTLRLWTGMNLLGGELELGGSYARGRGVEYAPGGEDARIIRPTIQLSGLDLSYRKAGRGASRLLLRGEYVRHRQKDGRTGFSNTADGYYAFADQRLDAHNEVGLRYDWSEFPTGAFAPLLAPDLHESAVSLIGTRALTEQTYLRLQVIHGNRPGKDNFTEMWFQWVWGLGPHTHNLE